MQLDSENARAKDIFEQARIKIEERGKKIDDTLKNAEKALKDGKWEEAIQYAKVVLQLDSENARAKDIFEQARIKIEERGKKIDDTLKNAEKALKDGKWEEAIQYAEEVIKMDPDNKSANKIKKDAQTKREERNKKIIDALENAEKALKEGKWKEAIQYADEIIKMDPGNKSANKIKKDAQTKREEKIATELKDAEKALKESKWGAAIRHAYEILYLNSKHTRAKEIVEHAHAQISIEEEKWRKLIEEDKKRGVKFSKDGKEIQRIPKDFEAYDIPKGISSIGEEAFSGCEKLYKVTIPDGVISIGKEAFSGCASLQEISLPASVESIGKKAFEGCANLQNVSIGPRVICIEEKTFYKCRRLSVISIPSVETIGEEAFAECNALENINFGTGLRFIKKEAFKCTGLKTIKISGRDVVTITIEENAFAECSSLTEAEIHHKVKIIGKQAFYKCVSLRKVSIGDSVECIGESAFAKCGELQNITIGSGVLLIGECAFKNCIKLEKIEIPGNVNTIDKGAFKGCSTLAKVVLAEGVKIVECHAFKECKALKEVEIPASTQEILMDAFDGAPCEKDLKNKYPSLFKKCKTWHLF